MTRRKCSASLNDLEKKKPARNLQSFRDEIKRISRNVEEKDLQTPLSLIVIAYYLNRLNFIGTINDLLRWDPQWKFSPGVLAQLLILVSFVPSRKKVAISRISDAFSGMDLMLLVGEPIDPEDLKDDQFALLLDRIHEYGCRTLFSTIALSVRTVFDLVKNYILHADTSSYVLFGDYDRPQSTDDSTVVKPARGYSKEKRPELKQIMSGTVTDGDGLPIFCHILDGNTADCEFNHQMVAELKSVFGDEFTKYTYTADSKLLTEKNFNKIYSGGNPVKFISRVPDNFSKKLSERMKKQAYLDNTWEYLGICCPQPSGKSTEPKYWATTYQRVVFGQTVWIHVYRKIEAEKHLRSVLIQKLDLYNGLLKDLCKKEFICKPDAQKELDNFVKKHKKGYYFADLSIVSTIEKKNPVGRPAKNPKPKIIVETWQIQAGEIKSNDKKIEEQRQKIDAFCLLSSISPDKMGSKDVILLYKGQNKVESLFSLLKEPLLASTIFLELPERIEALMTLLHFSVLMHGVLQVISREKLQNLFEPPRMGPENRPLIRPKSNTILNLLEIFDVITDDGKYQIQSKQNKHKDKLNLILYLVDFDPDKL
jgi:transposase